MTSKLWSPTRRRALVGGLSALAVPSAARAWPRHGNPAPPPVITSDGGGATATVNVSAGATAVTTVVATNGPTYSINGGADAALFTINSSSGVLAFIDASVAGDYEVTVRATNSSGFDSQTISAAVTGDDDMPLISSGRVTAAVEYRDIVLPAGLAPFQLTLVGWKFSQRDLLAAAFSYDGGSTFIGDTTNYDAYTYNELLKDSASAPGAGSYSTDSVMDLGPTFDAGQDVGLMAVIIINPGSATEYVSTLNRFAVSDNPATPAYRLMDSMCAMNKDATIPITKARANLVRLFPYGTDGVFNPPNTGRTITAGSWFLRGETTP